MKVRLEYVDGRSPKFWEVAVTGRTVTTRWGRIGTAGQLKATRRLTRRGRWHRRRSKSQ